MPESPRTHHKGRPRAQKVGGDISGLEPVRKRPPRPQAEAEAPLVRWADRTVIGRAIRFGPDRVPLAVRPRLRCVLERGHRGRHQYPEPGVTAQAPPGKRRCKHRKEP